MAGRFIKAELFRLSKMKAIIVVPIVLTLIILVQNYILLGFNGFNLNYVLFDDEEMYGDVAVTDDAAAADLETGYDVFGRTLPEDGEPVDEEEAKKLEEKSKKVFGGIGTGYYFTVSQTYQSGLQGEMPMLFIAIIAALFFGNDYSTHFSKNYPIINGRRWISAVAQLVVMGVFTMCIHVLVWILSFISNLFWADSINPGIGIDSMWYFLFSYLATMSIVTLIQFVATLFRSKAAAIVFSILTSVGVVSTPITIADLILKWRYGWEEFSLNYIIPTKILATVGSATSAKMMLLATIFVIIYLTSSVLGSIVLLRKRDMSTS